MGTIFYPNVIDHVNKYKYFIHGIPADYGVIEKYWISKDSPGPNYVPLRGEKSSMMIPISTLVDLYFNEVDFKFHSYDQMRQIERYLGTYISVMEAHQDNLSREQKEYINRAKNFFNFLKKKVDVLDKDELKKNLHNNDFFSAVYESQKKG